MNAETDTQSENRFVVHAQLTEKSALRYTPAGLPASEFKLEHSSEQMEAGQARTVQCELEAIAYGAVANQLDRISVGSQLKCSGFIARRSIRTQRLRFHVCEIELT